MRWLRGIAVAAAMAGGLATIVPVARAELEAEQVRDAIRRGIRFLESKQLADGRYPNFVNYDLTSLCALALLQAGVPPDNAQLKRALDQLRQVDQNPSSTYLTSLQTQVLCAAEPKRDLLLIRRNAAWLEEVQIKGGKNIGAWSYPNGGGDNSNTQFALLALHEAERVGVPVQDETWRRAQGYFQANQNPDGSWGYEPGSPGTASMTCAGIACLVIANGRLHGGDASLQGTTVRCCGDQQDNVFIQRGLDWLGKNFSVHANSGGRGLWLLYYLYGVERVGRMTAQRFIGQHDWYREGSEMLVRNQDQLSGFWRGSGHVEENEIISTALALLFLAKGRRPVLLARVQYGPENDDDWNHHRQALSHLTSYVESRWKRDLTWQVVDSRAATVDDLLQAPVLFLSGREAIQVSDEQVRRLRSYIDQGGFLLGEACCQDAEAFHRDFQALMQRVFPEPEYRLAELGPEHPVWQIEEPIPPDQVRPLWGIDYGCRTSVIYVPPHPATAPAANLSCLWELSRPGREQKLPAEVQQRVAGANALGINILAYATNREVKYKDEVPRVADRPQAADPVSRARLEIAKIKHGGGWNVAPAALVNLQRALNQEVGIRIGSDRHELNLTDPGLFNYHLIFLHGRHDFRFSDQERRQLRLFLDRGGMLLADAVCASEAFDRAFRRELAAIFPQQPLERVPAEHRLFSTDYGGFDLSTVQRRDPQRAAGPTQVSLRQVPPELEAITLSGRLAVVFSRYDLSCALEKHESLECRGYTREDAARIGINVVLYSLHE